MTIIRADIPATHDPNGSFCPTTLSIRETISNRVTPSMLQPGVAVSMNALAAFVDEMSDDEVLTYLVSVHEHRHFLDFVNTDVALIVMWGNLIQYFAQHAIYAYLCKSNQKQRSLTINELQQEYPETRHIVQHYQRTNRICRALWLGDTSLTQGQVCDDINWFVRELGGPECVVYTDWPDRPAAPSFTYENSEQQFGVGLLHVLEASATLEEDRWLEWFVHDPRRRHRLSRPQRDHRVYGALRDIVINYVLGSPTVASYFIRMSLDVNVTGLLHDLKKPFAYYIFHPAARCNYLSQLFASNFRIPQRTNLNKRGHDIYFSQHETLRQMYEASASLTDAHGFPIVTGTSPAVKTYADFSNRFAPSSFDGETEILATGQHNTMYWLHSWNELRKRRSQAPELFINPAAFEQRIEPISWDTPVTPFTTYGNGYVDTPALFGFSAEENEDMVECIFNLIGRRMRMDMFSYMQRGDEFNKSLNLVLSSYRWKYPNVFESDFDDVVSSVTEYMKETFT